jgi:peroxiredoxin
MIPFFPETPAFFIMVALNSPVCDFDWPAPDFTLPGVDDRAHTLTSARGPRGLLVMFICNHCPYVQAILDRLIRDCRDLQAEGIGSIAIMSNDTTAYPEDAFSHMRELARRLDFPFPYVYDETQEVARAYGAVCTPDFFGFNANLKLQYRGRLDASGQTRNPPDIRRELFEAMREIARTGQGPREQTASIGCSIKWREG